MVEERNLARFFDGGLRETPTSPSIIKIHRDEVTAPRPPPPHPPEKIHLSRSLSFESAYGILVHPRLAHRLIPDQRSALFPMAAAVDELD